MRPYSVLRSSKPCDRPLPETSSDGAGRQAFLQRLVAKSKLLVDVQELSKNDKQDLTRDPTVLAFAPQMPIRLLPQAAPLTPTTLPALPIKLAPSHAEATESAASWGISEVGADRTPYTGEGVVVAVLDTGIDASHPAFAGIELVERQFTTGESGDASGHGTHCAGTLLGRDVLGTRIGVARGVKKALIGKVLDRNGQGQASAIYSALYWAYESGANIISMSLGFDYTTLVANLIAQGCPAEMATSVALEAFHSNVSMFDALMGIIRASLPLTGGTIVVAAAGDESRRYIEPPITVGVSMPAAAQDIISVGALERQSGCLRASSFSNASPTVSAPGSGIVSAKTGGGLITMSGTSMAAPHVAGVAALWWESMQRAQLPVNARTVASRMLAATRTDRFSSLSTAADRGIGLIAAPQ